MHCFRQGSPAEGNGWGLAVNFVVLTRKFHVDRLKVTFLREVETVIRLGIKARFGDVA